MATLDRLAPPTSVLTHDVPAWTPRRALVVALTAAAAIALLQVLQSSTVASTGENLQRLEREKAARTAQIHQLEADVAALSSLDRIDRAARERLGMTPARIIQYVSVNTEAPSAPLLPRPLIDSSPAYKPQADPWWQALFRALPLP